MRLVDDSVGCATFMLVVRRWKLSVIRIYYAVAQ
jgi:hypothetical protein